MPETIAAEDRLAIQDNLLRYVWSLDTADTEGIVSTFTADGSVVAVDNERFSGAEGIRAFSQRAFAQPSFAGRQHHVQPVRFEKIDGGYLVTAYWFVITWDVGRPATLLSMGYYRDTCVKQNGEWRFKEKIITHWDGAKAPMSHKN
ncbi:MAG TPA: nuclear transport factor 2 family protein [Dehalococcoidia bacterium]|nr:nuclear transport factor 2 family protein [Dehalococcoidia bacterium]